MAWALAAVSAGAGAADVSLVGTFESKAAILSIDGGAPRTVRVGQSSGGVSVVSVEADRATIEVEGRRRVLVRGQSYSSASSGPQTATLTAGAGGHFFVEGQVNGGALRFVVDTGATTVVIPGADAVRLRIDYRAGRQVTMQTAAGAVTAYLVTLESVRVGPIELQGVTAVVVEQGLQIALLGNSFLNRMEMRRDGQTMTLVKRF